MTDRDYMFLALEHAKKGLGWVSPNPPVGCVIVDKLGKIVGEGWHQRYGEAHAEVNALTEAGVEAKDATAYVTLMPCNHYGKTPPCTQALINAGVKRVVVSLDDPDPVSGSGSETLRAAGITVEIGLLAADTFKLMHGFIKYIRMGLPHVTLKYAMTLDGCIATAAGDSKWISSDESRDSVQLLRSQSDAVLVGSATMLKDNPRLNVRDYTQAQPFRVIADTALVTPVEAEIFKTVGGKVILLAGERAALERRQVLQRAGAEILTVPEQSGHIDLSVALRSLGEVFGVRSIICEGGSGIAGALLRQELVDRIVAFVAPKVLGGNGLSPTSGDAPELMCDAMMLEDFDCRMLGADAVCTGWLKQSLAL